MVCFLPLPFFKVSDAWLDPRLETESAMDASKPKPGEKWDQFEVNSRLTGRFAVPFNESIYTSALDKSKLGENKVIESKEIAKGIERQAGETIHEAEERGQKVGPKGLDEEDLEDGLAPKGGSRDAMEKDKKAKKAKVGSPEPASEPAPKVSELAPGASEFAAWTNAEVQLEEARQAVLDAKAMYKASWAANKRSMLSSGKSKAEARQRMALAISELRAAEENYPAVMEGAELAFVIWRSLSEGGGGSSSDDHLRESKATDDPIRITPAVFFNYRTDLRLLSLSFVKRLRTSSRDARAWPRRGPKQHPSLPLRHRRRPWQQPSRLARRQRIPKQVTWLLLRHRRGSKARPNASPARAPTNALR